MTGRAVADAVTPAHRRPAPLEFGSPLTTRELRVLRLVAQGMENRQIATELFLAEATVKSHLTRLFTRMGAVNRAHAVALGYQAKLLVPGQPKVAGTPRPALPAAGGAR